MGDIQEDYENGHGSAQTKKDGTQGTEDHCGKLYGGDCAVFQSPVCDLGGNRYASDRAGYKAGYDPACCGTVVFLRPVGPAALSVFSIHGEGKSSSHG